MLGRDYKVAILMHKLTHDIILRSRHRKEVDELFLKWTEIVGLDCYTVTMSAIVQSMIAHCEDVRITTKSLEENRILSIVKKKLGSPAYIRLKSALVELV